MTADDVLADLRWRDFEVLLRDGKLIVRPGSKLTEADCERIKEHRSDLLELLSCEWITADDGTRSLLLGPLSAEDREAALRQLIWSEPTATKLPRLEEE